MRKCTLPSLIIPLGLVGVGFSFVVSSVTDTVVGTVPSHLAGMASATTSMLRDFGFTLGPAGWLMFISALLLFAGTALALIGLRRPAKGPDPSLDPKDGKAVASLVLGIVGVVLPFVSAPAIGLGLFAMDDVRVTGGRIGGRGLAVAGFVLGIVSLSLWGLGLLLGMLLAQP